VTKTEAPALETSRLHLRHWRAEDFESYAALMADADVMRSLGGVQSRNDAWRNFAMVIGHWHLRGFGFWAVERKSDGALLGRIGLWQPEGWPGLEVGWTLGREHWGQGYATEAAEASLDYGFRTYPVDRLISLIAPENHASQRVAKRIGEVPGEPWVLRIGNGEYLVDIWSITRAAWQARQNA
jgi:RimJ/RimL family protein N-acetyltransferase